jgi:Methane oxygenase PmoA
LEDWCLPHQNRRGSLTKFISRIVSGGLAMIRIHRCLVGLTLLAIVLPAFGQTTLPKSKIVAQFEMQNTGPEGILVSIPIDIREEFASLTDVNLACLPITTQKVQGTIRAQLTAPSLLTGNSLPSVKGMVHRELHFLSPVRDARLTTIVFADESKSNNSKGFFWSASPGEYSQLMHDGIPVLRYVHKPYDNSSPANRDKTYKVFHHLYDSTGKRFVTNGGDTNEPMPKNPKDSLYPHHRGLMYAFNIITFDGNKKCDTWHAKPGDTHQSHEGFLSTEVGQVLGRHRVAVDWHGPSKEVFAKEEREITVYKLDKGTLVEFASRLKSTGGLVKLAGDPQHAGFQFRAHNDLHEQKMDKQTYYLRPDGKGPLGDTRNWDPKTKQGPINLLWDAGSFVIDGKRYTVAYLNNPKNPGESRWSERDYGRFGCYFEYDLTPENPLVVNYRVWLQDGEMTVEQVQALSKAFLDPPKVTVK